MSSISTVMSPLAAFAVPENVGAVLFVDVPSAGEVSVTGTFAGVSVLLRRDRVDTVRKIRVGMSAPGAATRGDRRRDRLNSGSRRGRTAVDLDRYAARIAARDAARASDRERRVVRLGAVTRRGEAEGRQVGVDRPRLARGRARVARLVDGAHLECVRAVAQPGVVLG